MKKLILLFTICVLTSCNWTTEEPLIVTSVEKANNEKLIEYYFYFGLIVTILNVILSICLFSPNVVYSIHKKWFKWKANEVLYTKKEVNEILTNLRKRIIEAKGTDKYILTSGNEFFGVCQELLL